MVTEPKHRFWHGVSTSPAGWIPPSCPHLELAGFGDVLNAFKGLVLLPVHVQPAHFDTCTGYIKQSALNTDNTELAGRTPMQHKLQLGDSTPVQGIQQLGVSTSVQGILQLGASTPS